MVKYLPMAQETRVKSQIVSYQRLKKRYLMRPCLTPSIMWIKGKWNNPGKGIPPSPTPIENGAFGLLSTTVGQLYIYIYI